MCASCTQAKGKGKGTRTSNGRVYLDEIHEKLDADVDTSAGSRSVRYGTLGRVYLLCTLFIECIIGLRYCQKICQIACFVRRSRRRNVYVQGRSSRDAGERGGKATSGS